MTRGPILVRLVDVAQLLGISKQRAHQLAQREDFPSPVEASVPGRLWRRRDVITWAQRSYRGGAARWGRRPDSR